MEIQNLINHIYNKNNPINNDLLSRLNVGDLLKAKVIAMAGDLITLEINNNLTLEAKDTSSISYNIGDVVEFIISDKVDDKLFIKSNASTFNSLEDKLSQIGIKVDENNKELIELLYKSQVPITKDNIEKILSTKNYYGKLVGLIKDADIPIDSQIINDDIREVLKNIIQKEYETSKSKTNQEDFIRQNDKTSINQQNIESSNSNETIKTNNDTSFIKDFFDNNSNISLEKLVFMLKNNMNFNTKNFVLLNNVISGQKTITNQIEDLIKVLEENDLTGDSYTIDEKNNKESSTKNQLVDLLRKFDISNIKEKDKLNSIMKELFKRLEVIKDGSLTKETNTIINRHFDEIKTSLDFVNKLNENITFIQVPLHMNNSLKNLDIYINKDAKSNKNRSKKNTKIFISLNTNNLDLVQVYIEINKKDLSINFRVCNDKIKNIIKSNEKNLSNNLNGYDFNNIIFKYNVSTERMNLTNIDADNNKSKLSTLDIRV